MDKETKKYPQDYSYNDLCDKINDYADDAVGSKSSDILVQHYTKAGLGIAELQRRLMRWTLWIAIIALLVSAVK